MDQKPFSAWRALQNDFSLTLPIMLPIVAWVVYLLPLIFMGGSPFFFYLAVVITVVGPLLLVWKLVSIRRIIQQGQQLTGVIRSTQFIKDRGRINYTYRYNDQLYNGTVAVHMTEQAKSFQSGQEVGVSIDLNNPQESYLRGLYT